MAAESLNTNEEEKDCCKSGACQNAKLVLSTIVVLLLVAVVFAGVALGYSVLHAPWYVNYILMFMCLTLLAYVEALHYACVAVEKWDMESFAAKYPRAKKCHALVDTPEKVKKFLVGRQFFVIFVVFLLAEITTFPEIPKNFAGLPQVMVLLLLQTGLPGIALTLTFGQLISQLFVEEFTVQVLNMYGCEFVIRLSLFAEWIGICHFSWLLYFTASRLVCSKVRKAQKQIDQEAMQSRDDAEMLADPMTPTEKIRGPDYDSGVSDINWFDYPRFLWSTAATLGAMVVVAYGISIKAYVLPVPPVAAYIVAIVALTILFYLEGLMIAIVGTQYWDPEQFKDAYPRAYEMHKFVNQPDNVKRFIIGRQFFTVLTNFLLAQVFVFKYWDSGAYNPILFFILIKSGLVGVLIILSCGQLLPELLAAEYPLRFMDMRGACTIVYISQFFDMIGVGHCAWTVYFVTRSLLCGKHMEEGHVGKAAIDTKPDLLIVNSAEILAASTEKTKEGRGIPRFGK